MKIGMVLWPIAVVTVIGVGIATGELTGIDLAIAAAGLAGAIAGGCPLLGRGA